MGADAGHAVADGDAGQLPAPRGVGAPKAINGIVAICRHRSRAADGQPGVVAAAVLCEAPGEAVVGGGAADGLERGANGDVAGADGDGGALLVVSYAAARGSRGVEALDDLVGIVNGQRVGLTFLIVFRCVVGAVGAGGHGEAAGTADGVYLAHRGSRRDVLLGHRERVAAVVGGDAGVADARSLVDDVVGRRVHGNGGAALVVVSVVVCERGSGGQGETVLRRDGAVVVIGERHLNGAEQDVARR